MDGHYLYVALVYRACMYKGLIDRLVRVLQLIVLAYQADAHFVGGVLQFSQKYFPRGQVGFSSVLEVEFGEHNHIQPFFQHEQRHIVDRFHINRLDNRRHVHVAKLCEFAPDFHRERVFGAADQDIGLNSCRK